MAEFRCRLLPSSPGDILGVLHVAGYFVASVLAFPEGVHNRSGGVINTCKQRGGGVVEGPWVTLQTGIYRVLPLGILAKISDTMTSENGCR